MNTLKTCCFVFLFLLVIGLSTGTASADIVNCYAPTPILACTVNGTNCNTANPDLNCLGDGGYMNLPVGDIYPFTLDSSLGFGGYCQGGWGVDSTGYCNYPLCQFGSQANEDWWYYYFLTGNSDEASYLTACRGQ